MLRLFRGSTAVLTVFTVLVACTEPTSPRETEQPSPPPIAPGGDVIYASAVSPRESVARPETQLKTLPSVRVYNLGKSKPVAGATVLFTLLTPDGTITAKLPVTTSSDGIATVPAWKMGPSSGRYQAVAQLEGGNSVDFFVYVRGEVVAIYDLIALEGEPFGNPFVTTAHYVVFNDGTYYHVYNSDLDEQTAFATMSGTYTRESSGVINFYSSAPSIFGGPFATGTPGNGTLRVTYSDYVDYSIEIYAMR